MNQGQPSKTAEWVAQHRAAHQLLDAPPRVLEDPVAVPILSPEQRMDLSRERERHQQPASRFLRAYMVARSRYAEEVLARAVAAGVRQYVILGAGLDTFAYRNPFSHVRVFEVDHPSTQAWKRERLSAASIPLPPSVTFAPVDFESQSLTEGLAAAGFQFERPVFFCWLGVTSYLTLEPLRSTLAFIGARPPGSGVVLDYILPHQELSEEDRRTMEEMTVRVAALGEPFRLFLSSREWEAELTRAGLEETEILDGPTLNARYFAQREDGLETFHGGLTNMCSAWVRAPR